MKSGFRCTSCKKTFEFDHPDKTFKASREHICRETGSEWDYLKKKSEHANSLMQGSLKVEEPRPDKLVSNQFPCDECQDCIFDMTKSVKKAAYAEVFKELEKIPSNDLLKYLNLKKRFLGHE